MRKLRIEKRSTVQELTKLIREDMKPALGVTEPGAIAFSVAKAKSYVDGEIIRVRVSLNSGLYKNAFTCGIPNSDYCGNLYAAALGAVAGRDELGLESLRDIDERANEEAERLIKEQKIQVDMGQMSSDILIVSAVTTDKGSCTVYIEESHTNVVKVEKDGILIWEKVQETQGQRQTTSVHGYTLKQILQYIHQVPCDELSFLEEAYTMNMELLEAGTASEKSIFGPWLLKDNGGHFFSQDVHKTAQFLCNGAIEARVMGMSKPAMSITGSGAHGIIATLPLYAYIKVVEQDGQEKLWRATALSYLITMYIKEYSGKLSAFCGCAIAAGTGMACGLYYLMSDASEEQYHYVIQNMASGITGMICDGGNQGCVMKGIVAVDAAFRAVELAMEDVRIHSIHGINGLTPEDTMRNMGLIASPGMVQTEEIIVNIMKCK